MSKKIKIPKATKGKGYSGVWKSEQLGWWVTDHVHPKSLGDPNMQAIEKGYLKGERVFLCEITIKPLLDKKGRPITKIIK
jgi:hypothetical protein